MNILYTMTLQGKVCTSQMIDSAIDDLLALSSNTYDMLLIPLFKFCVKLFPYMIHPSKSTP